MHRDLYTEVLYSECPSCIGYPQPSLCQATVRRFPGFAQGYAGGKRVKFKVTRQSLDVT